MRETFPQNSAERKGYPVYSGLLQYFPAALAAIAHHSFVGNEKHNPGLPLHWDRAKSDDEADALLRHLMEGDYVGMGWRALALLQKHLEACGAATAPGAWNAHIVECGGCAPPVYTSAERVQKTPEPVHDPLPKWSPGWLAEQGIPAESAYIASLKSSGFRAATAEEIVELRNAMTAGALREFGIGDVAHSRHLPTSAAHPQHPLRHVVLDERGPEDKL